MIMVLCIWEMMEWLKLLVLEMCMMRSTITLSCYEECEACPRYHVGFDHLDDLIMRAILIYLATANGT